MKRRTDDDDDIDAARRGKRKKRSRTPPEPAAHEAPLSPAESRAKHAHDVRHLRAQVQALEAQVATMQDESVSTTKHIVRDLVPLWMGQESKEPVVAAMVSNQVVNFHAEVIDPTAVEPIGLNTRPGVGVFRQTLCFVAQFAAFELYPARGVLRIEHGFGVESSNLSRAYFCQFADHEPVSAAEVKAISTRMQEIVARDMPIEEVVLTHKKAIAYFEENKHTYVAKYLRSRSFPLVKVNRCGDFMILSHADRGRIVAPRTGIVRVWEVTPYSNGLLLRFPTLTDDGKHLVLKPFLSQPLIRKSYEEVNQWASKLEVDCVGDINQMIVDGHAREVVHLCEAMSDTKITDIARDIAKRNGDVRLVLVAGPSSSGKTTFAAKLRIQLTAAGFRPVMFSTDDYYRPSNDPDYPKLPNGKPDFEDVNAMRLDLLNDHLRRLFKGEEVMTPIFNFKTERPNDEGRLMKLRDGDILIAEGIFCLHDQLTREVPDAQKFRIYISPMSQLNLDEGHFMSNQVLRLIRRISRDFLHRGRDARASIARWDVVRSGEERNIFPFINNADVVMNSSLDYELNVLKVHVEPLLEAVKPDHKEYTVARQMHGLLKMFHPLPGSYVPSTSLLREFVGRSDFEDA